MYKTAGMFKAGSNMGNTARYLWSREINYPLINTSGWTIESRCFETSTLRGKPLNDRNLFKVFTDQEHIGKIVFRGMAKTESDCKYNQDIHGLVGRDPSIFTDRKNLDYIMSQHQGGNVKGVCTSINFRTGKSFANNLNKADEVMIIDLRNVPEKERYSQQYVPGAMGISSTGDDVDYSNEGEITLSGAHTSASVARVNRKNLMSWIVESNPCYVDQDLLSEDLKEKYAKTLDSYYDYIHAPSDDKKIAFKELERNFYQEIGEKLNYSDTHKAAIEYELKKGEILQERPEL
jgi:hypothetical protein